MLVVAEAAVRAEPALDPRPSPRTGAARPAVTRRACRHSACVGPERLVALVAEERGDDRRPRSGAPKSGHDRPADVEVARRARAGYDGGDRTSCGGCRPRRRSSRPCSWRISPRPPGARITPPLEIPDRGARPGCDLHRLARGDDVVVDERAHVDLLLHPAGPVAAAGRAAAGRPAAAVPAGDVGGVERLDPAVRREEVEGRRPPVQGAPRRRDPEHRRLLGREVDAAVVRAPDQRDRPLGPRLAEEIPVLPVERGDRRASPRRPRATTAATTTPARHRGAAHDLAPVAGARDDDRPQRDEQPEHARRKVFLAGSTVGGQPSPAAVTAAATNGRLPAVTATARQNAAAVSTTST